MLLRYIVQSAGPDHAQTKGERSVWKRLKADRARHGGSPQRVRARGRLPSAIGGWTLLVRPVCGQGSRGDQGIVKADPAGVVVGVRGRERMVQGHYLVLVSLVVHLSKGGLSFDCSAQVKLRTAIIMTSGAVSFAPRYRLSRRFLSSLSFWSTSSSNLSMP